MSNNVKSIDDKLNELTQNQQRLVEWLATPGWKREPETKGELAEELKVTNATISRWIKKFEMTKLASELAFTRIGDDLPEVYGALLEKAKMGSHHHIKMVLELTEKYTQKIELNVNDRRESLKGEIENLLNRENDEE